MQVLLVIVCIHTYTHTHTHSLSGYESESALVSQSSLEQADTQMLVKLNSSLARFILMLDIWLAQVGVCMYVPFCRVHSLLSCMYQN